MPALAQALSGALPEAALRQLMQALGNCQQPLTHRGAINLQPPVSTGPGGLARPGTWNPSAYSQLMPNAGQDVRVDIAGDTFNNTNNTSNYGGHQFSFPIDQSFTYNNYFGGDTFNVAGDSHFDNSTHVSLTAGDTNITQLTVKYLTVTGDGPALPAPEGPGGMPDGGGGGGIPGPQGPGGGGPFMFPMPAVTQVATYLKDVTVRGTVNVLETTGGTLKDKAVDVTSKTATKTLSVAGEIVLPTVDGVSLTAFTSSGKASVTTITGGTVSGGTASGTIAYDTFPTATCSTVSGTVSIFSGGTFSGTPSGIAVTATLGTLAGTVSVPTIASAYLDANCNIVLVTGFTYVSVNFSGAPTVTVSSQGTVSGGVTLTGSTSRALNIVTPTITVNKSASTAAATLSVGGITFAPTTGSTDVNVSLTTATAAFSLVNGSTTQAITAAGTLIVNEPDTASVRHATVDPVSGTVSKPLKLTVGKRSDFLVYLRPRI
jgi:hypothetical protein